MILLKTKLIVMVFLLYKLAADPDPNVKNGAELLDRLVKVGFASCEGWCLHLWRWVSWLMKVVNLACEAGCLGL